MSYIYFYPNLPILLSDLNIVRDYIEDCGVIDPTDYDIENEEHLADLESQYRDEIETCIVEILEDRVRSDDIDIIKDLYDNALEFIQNGEVMDNVFQKT